MMMMMRELLLVGGVEGGYGGGGSSPGVETLAQARRLLAQVTLWLQHQQQAEVTSHPAAWHAYPPPVSGLAKLARLIQAEVAYLERVRSLLVRRASDV